MRFQGKYLGCAHLYTAASTTTPLPGSPRGYLRASVSPSRPGRNPCDGHRRVLLERTAASPWSLPQCRVSGRGPQALKPLNHSQGAVAREGTCFYPVWPQGRCWRGRATCCSPAPGGGHCQADVRHQNTVQEMRPVTCSCSHNPTRLCTWPSPGPAGAGSGSVVGFDAAVHVASVLRSPRDFSSAPQRGWSQEPALRGPVSGSGI